MAVLQRVANRSLFKISGLRSFASCFNLKQKEKQSFFQALWESADVSAYTDAHSKTLTDDNAVTYELVFDNVKPGCMIKYMEATKDIQTKLHSSSDYPISLVGSWTSIYGELDQAVHIWMFKDGYKAMAETQKMLANDKDVMEYSRLRGDWLNSRKNQICHHFGYWGEPQPRKPSNIYEMRSYSLKPGTLIQWSNKWGQAISIRRKDAVCGFFSQVGDLYEVHHMWAYKDLDHRRVERERMWQQPGWDDCVAATVPLVREMKCSILTPNEISPLQ